MSWQSDMGLPPDWQPPGFGGNGLPADSSLGTDVRMPDGTYQHFDPQYDANGNPVSPKIFISDSLPGGYAAAMPGTPEYDHYSSVMQRDNAQGVAKVGALVGGGALAGALLGGGAAAGGVGDAGAAAGGAGSGSAIGGGAGTSLSALGGTAPITGTAIDAAGNAIGPAAAFGTSSIPFDGGALAAAGGGLGALGNGAGAGAAAAAPNMQLTDPAPAGGTSMPGLQDQNSIVDQLAGDASSSLSGSGLPGWLQSLLPYSGLIGSGLGLVDSLLQPKSTTQTNQGTSNSTSTSGLQLPSQLTGAAGTALDRANQLLTQGQQFAPSPYILNQAAGNLAGLGQNTAPTTSSFASGANINPYLDTEFNAAADATQNRLASEFANAGQFGSPQNTQARSQELQQLAAGIYGPGYQNAQNLQYGAQEAGVSRGLQQQDSNLNRTLQSAQVALPLGQYMQQQQQQQLNAPYTNLNQYIGQLGGISPFFPGTYTQSQAGNQTGNYTQPLYNNPLTAALGGASLGSYYGNLLGGGQPQQPQQSPQNATWQQGGFGGYNQYAY